MFALPPPRLLIKRLASVTGDIVNVENIAIVAVVNLWILCHLQRLVVVKVPLGLGFASGKSLQPNSYFRRFAN